uniref:Uncharacterized protein n=1 Tax=Cacopsylla melanoneura TaxID=428564 RepID=A0A8D8X323_9HEMI
MGGYQRQKSARSRDSTTDQCCHTNPRVFQYRWSFVLCKCDRARTLLIQTYYYGIAETSRKSSSKEIGSCLSTKIVLKQWWSRSIDGSEVSLFEMTFPFENNQEQEKESFYRCSRELRKLENFSI